MNNRYEIIMNPKTYQRLALQTESLPDKIPVGSAANVNEITMSRLVHAGLGIATEAGEFLDPLKKGIFYGREIDIVNLKEEIGDILWYLAIACDALNTDLETEMIRNIKKLQTRYPEKFKAKDAIHRNLEAERAALEE